MTGYCNCGLFGGQERTDAEALEEKDSNLDIIDQRYMTHNTAEGGNNRPCSQLETQALPHPRYQ